MFKLEDMQYFINHAKLNGLDKAIKLAQTNAHSTSEKIKIKSILVNINDLTLGELDKKYYKQFN